MTKGKKMSEKTFEEKIARLEEIVSLLERGDAQLSDSLLLFEEGTMLASDCTALLSTAEQKVVTLMKGADGGPVEGPFVSEE